MEIQPAWAAVLISLIALSYSMWRNSRTDNKTQLAEELKPIMQRLDANENRISALREDHTSLKAASSAHEKEDDRRFGAIEDMFRAIREDNREIRDDIKAILRGAREQ